MDEEKVTLWKQRMTSFQSSGLSIKKWCRENHIAPPTFYYWRSRLENEIVTNQPTFVEVKQIEKTIVATQSHNVAMSWKELHFEIASKEGADLAAYFIRQLQSSC